MQKLFVYFLTQWTMNQRGNIQKKLKKKAYLYSCYEHEKVKPLIFFQIFVLKETIFPELCEYWVQNALYEKMGMSYYRSSSMQYSPFLKVDYVENLLKFMVKKNGDVYFHFILHLN